MYNVSILTTDHPSQVALEILHSFPAPPAVAPLVVASDAVAYQGLRPLRASASSGPFVEDSSGLWGRPLACLPLPCCCTELAGPSSFGVALAATAEA